MNKNLRALNSNIINNIDLEKSMPSFFQQARNKYFAYGAIRLALHYYTFYETFRDYGLQWGEEAIGLVKDLNQIIGHNINLEPNAKTDLLVKDTDKLRNKIMQKMKILIVYTDIFSIYESILNRVKYRFKDDEEVEIENDDEFAREILRYIFDSQDNLLINEKIRDIVGQLPVRIARKKYFDIIKDSFSNYIDAEWSSLQSYLYTLRTNSMIYKEEGMESEYPWLWDQSQRLSKMDYKNLTRAQYDEMEEILAEATQILTKDTEHYYFLQEMVNELYALLLCKPYVKIEEDPLKEQIEAALDIIQTVSELFEKTDNDEKEFTEVNEYLIGKLSKIEGAQEELSYEVTNLEEGVYQANENHRELAGKLKIEKELDALLLSKDLLSTSLFIDFYEIKTRDKVDKASVEKERDKFIHELSVFLKNHDRFIARAIMANTLSAIPVFFNDHKEVMDYVRYSLDKCTDMAEKKACNKIIRQMMID